MHRLPSAVLCVVLLVLVPPAAPVQAQEDLSDLRESLRVLGEEYAAGYVKPVTDAFGADVNAGLFRTADVGEGFLPLLPVDVYVGFSVSGALLTDADKQFTPPASETIRTSEGEELTLRFTGGDVPTAFGETSSPDDASLVIEDEQGNTQTIDQLPPGLVDTPVAPLVIPQVGLGTLAGTDVLVRYLPQRSLREFGSVRLFGLAVRHDLDQWVPGPFPLNVAVQGSWNQFSLQNQSLGDPSVVQDVLDASGWAVNLQASRSVPLLPLLVYGGVQYERFSAEYRYTFQPDGTTSPVELTVDQSAANTVRALAGVSITLTVLRINVDYAASHHNTITAGIGLRL